jgi:O-acetyl-ADP-ribose deacetylase (regulator of RNase III)
MEKKIRKMRCCFCKKALEGDESFGNNPAPANNNPRARCCNDCNFKVVLPFRMGIHVNHNKGKQGIKIVLGDITKQEVDVIVNSSNKALKMGSGVSMAIHKAAGKEMEAELEKFGRLELGKAVVSEGYKLPCKLVIHALAPKWFITEEAHEHILENCYRSCYDWFVHYSNHMDIKTIAFPSIGTGLHRVPIEIGSKVAIRMAQDLHKQYPNEFTVIFVLDNQDDFDVYERTLAEMSQ